MRRGDRVDGRSLPASLLAGLLLASPAVIGCADESSGVLLHVDAQRWGATHASSLRVTVWSVDGDRVLEQDFGLGDDGALLPVVVWVRSTSGGEAQFLAAATLLGPSGETIHTAWGTGTVEPGRLSRALLCVADGCRFSRCGSPAACVADPVGCRRCDLGACVAPALERFAAAGRPMCPAAGEAGVESTCWDAADDDRDGDVDCADADCDGEVCDELGRACVGGTCSCAAETELRCDDGVDDDCDGRVDCDDDECLGMACAEHGRQCGDDGCECPGGEAPELTCDDGVDNDCNGVADCADVSCGGRSCNADTDEICDPDSLGACVCPWGDVEVCDDAIDNDCNGLNNCAEGATCDGMRCGDGHTCRGGVCTPTECVLPVSCGVAVCDGAECGANGRRCIDGVCACPGRSNERSCADGADNDCDGLVDCRDPDCNHLRAFGPNHVCCGGSRVDYTGVDNCGGCNLSCATGTRCLPIAHDTVSGYVCGCGASGLCPGNAGERQECRDYGGVSRCSCRNSSECRAGQACVRQADVPNLCLYDWQR